MIPSSLSLLSSISWMIWQRRVEVQVKEQIARLKDLLRGIISGSCLHSTTSGAQKLITSISASSNSLPLHHSINPHLPPPRQADVSITPPLNPNHKWLTNFTAKRLNCSFTITMHCGDELIWSIKQLDLWVVLVRKVLAWDKRSG